MLNPIDLARVDLNLLVVFEAVFRARHVGNAARQLHITPSAVSHGLGRLRQLFDDPLFLKVPKGVLPSARALELAPHVLEILERVRSVVGGVEAFDPKTSTRRFKIAAPDAILATLLPPLVAAIERAAPFVDLSSRQCFPMEGLRELDAGMHDLALLPLDDIPPRFVHEVAFQDEFVIVARAGHAFFEKPTLASYCAQQHIVVSIEGDPNGFLDLELAKLSLKRRVALTVPHFVLALAVLPETDLVCAVPSSFLAKYAGRFGIRSARMPFPLRVWDQRVIASKAAMEDRGVAWLFEVVAAQARKSSKGRPAKRRG